MCLTAQLCIEKYFNQCEVRENKQVHLPDQMVNGAIVLSSQILRIYEISKSLRHLIVIPQVHKMKQFYSKTHAVKVITAHRKGTSERAAAYSFLLKNGCVPSERALRTEVDKFDSGSIVIDEEWNVKRGRKKHHNKVRLVSVDGKVFPRAGFIGRLLMALQPVNVHHIHGTPLIQTEFYASPNVIDLYDCTANRAYFNPKQFPTPANLDNADKTETYAKLVKYVYEVSERCGTPVVSRGSSRPGSKQFVCKHIKKHNCKYRFILKWDRFGYYIHLYGHRRKLLNRGDKFCIGNLWHNHDHDREAPSPFETYRCKCCCTNYTFYDIGRPCVKCCKDTT